MNPNPASSTVKRARTDAAWAARLENETRIHAPESQRAWLGGHRRGEETMAHEAMDKKEEYEKEKKKQTHLIGLHASTKSRFKKLKIAYPE